MSIQDIYGVANLLIIPVLYQCIKLEHRLTALETTMAILSKKIK